MKFKSINESVQLNEDENQSNINKEIEGKISMYCQEHDINISQLGTVVDHYFTDCSLAKENFTVEEWLSNYNNSTPIEEYRNFKIKVKEELTEMKKKVCKTCLNEEEVPQDIQDKVEILQDTIDNSLPTSAEFDKWFSESDFDEYPINEELIEYMKENLDNLADDELGAFKLDDNRKYSNAELKAIFGDLRKNPNNIYVSSDGEIEKALDATLAASFKEDSTAGTEYPALCISGIAGAGKSAVVEAWAKKHGLNLVELKATDLSSEDWTGVPFSDDKSDKTKPAFTSKFDDLDMPNSVLFLDELNRSDLNDSNKFLDLINAHKISKGKRDPITNVVSNRYFPELLFVVAAVNPATSSNNQVRELSMPERGRMKIIDVSINPQSVLGYLKHEINLRIKFIETRLLYQNNLLEVNVKFLLGYLLALKNIKRIAEILLGNPDSANLFDTEDTLEMYMDALDRYYANPTAYKPAANNGVSISDIKSFMNGLSKQSTSRLSATSPRTLTRLLLHSDGTVDDILDNWNSYCSPWKKPVAEMFLNGYKDYDLDALKVFLKDSKSPIVRDILNNKNNSIDDFRKAASYDEISNDEKEKDVIKSKNDNAQQSDKSDLDALKDLAGI